MQFANTVTYAQQVSATSDSIEQGCFSALSKQSSLHITAQYTSEATGKITLNCSGLESINSHGICLLIKLLIYSKLQQKHLQVFGLSKHNRYIFEITRLDK